MDLVSLACEEIGLDLEHETKIEDNDMSLYLSDGNISIINIEEDVSGFDVPIIDSITFYGDLSNTVFTDSEGKETKLIVQEDSSRPEKPPVVVPLWVNPVQHLRAQSTVPKFHRRPRKSEIVSSIQGAPCRKLPELESKQSSKIQNKTPTPISVAESEVVSVQVQEDNPFRDLLKDTDQGKIAFAFYVMECWEKQKTLQDAGEKEAFVRQCSKWWTDLPTPYRRIYWSKEIEYTKKKNMSHLLGRTWVNNNCKEKSKPENAVPESSNGKRKSSQECSQPSKSIKKEVVEAVPEEEYVEEESLPPPPPLVDSKNIANEFEKEEKRPKEALLLNAKKKRSFELLKAFSNFQKVHREKVSKEKPGASKLEVKRELGKRWKSLEEKQKIKYLDSSFISQSSEKNEILRDNNQDNVSQIKREIIKEECISLKHEVRDEFCEEFQEEWQPQSPDSERRKSLEGGDDKCDIR